MIFSAGLGTRLKPLTDTTPKALIPLAGKTLLQWQIEKLKAAGITDIVVNVHHFAEQVIDYLREHDNFGCNIQVSDERDMLLETGGGLRHAKQLLASSPHRLIASSPLRLIASRLSTAWAIGQTFVFITFTRLFFRSGSNLDPATASQEAWETATNMVNQIGGAWNSSIIPAFLWEYRYVVILFVLGMVIHWLPTRWKRWYRVRFALLPTWAIIMIAALTVIVVYQFVTADMQAFIYFQF